ELGHDTRLPVLPRFQHGTLLSFLPAQAYVGRNRLRNLVSTQVAVGGRVASGGRLVWLRLGPIAFQPDLFALNRNRLLDVVRDDVFLDPDPFARAHPRVDVDLLLRPCHRVAVLGIAGHRGPRRAGFVLVVGTISTCCARRTGRDGRVPATVIVCTHWSPVV